jgi:hypothetical protein
MADAVVNNEEKNRKFVETLAVIRQVFEAGLRANLAFWLGVWHGEAGRENGPAWLKQGLETDPKIAFAFEFGLQLGPEIQQAGKLVLSALIQAGVAALIGAVGIKSPNRG